MLLTKLHIPPVSDNLVYRSDLFDKLNFGLNRKLILVSAPAGFGKTTAVTCWIHQNKIRAAWYSLDKGDNDPVEFLSYIILGVQTINSEFGQNTLKLLKSPNQPTNESVVRLLINEILQIGQNFLLVLDDFHLITNHAILELVAYFIEHMPKNIHLVIVTRSDPPMSIARLRSQQQLVELRTSDLSFSANDISILFNKKLKIGLSIEEVYSLVTKTEGWIAGLQLTALSMHGRDNISAFIQGLKGDNRYIMDYLIEEVLKIQTSEIKDFLLKTSILSQFSAPLCNALLNKTDSIISIEQLEKNNMFVIPLDSDRNWYRYHHLFADLLKQRLLLGEKYIVDELHRKACEWFEKNNMYQLAIEHALENQDFQKSIQLLGHVAENMWQNGQHAAILDYGAILPDELIKENPAFCLYYSWILISSGKIKKAEPFLTSAEQTIKQLILDKDSRLENTLFEKKLLGKIAVAFAYSNSHEEHSAKTFEYCQTAMDNLSQEDPLWYSWAWFSYAVSYFAVGDFQQSFKSYEKALEYGKKSGNIYLISTIIMRMSDNEQQLGNYSSAYKRCTELLSFIKGKGYQQITENEWVYAPLYFILGTTQYMWADLENSINNILLASNLSKNTNDIYPKVLILMVSSVLLKELGEADAEKRAEEVDELIKHNDIPPYLLSIYIGWKIYMLLQKNQIDEANQFVKDYGMGIDKKKDHTNEIAYSSYAKLLMVQGKLVEAQHLISELFTLANQSKRIEQIIQLHVSYAELYKLKGNREKAISSLIEAMKLASKENLLIYFVYSFDVIEDLLDDIFKQHDAGKTAIPAQFIENIKQFIEKKKKLKKNTFGLDISAREIDTLKLLADGLSNQKIADKLFISLNTVKTHLKNIYLKLDVDSRTKAFEKAKELGLL